MRKLNCFLAVVLIIFYQTGKAQSNAAHIEDPVEVIKLIGDKLIRDTPFEYKLTLNKVNPVFDDLHFVDFGRTFGLGRPAVAYAYTFIESPSNMQFHIQLEHNDGCSLWLNGQIIYSKNGDRQIQLVHEERSIELPEELTLNLKKGINTLLVKSETKGDEWTVFLQPPSIKGAILAEKTVYPAIGIANVPNVDKNISGLSNWLVIGPFPNEMKEEKRNGISIPYAPENEFVFGRMYAGADGLITWTIPKVEVLGDLIDSKDWGTNYHWNYHNGGVAWAMQHMAEITGEYKYAKFANDFCDFHLRGKPFVDYQVNTLNAIYSANHFFINTPLLDFTLAPSLAYIYRLRKEADFENRSEYSAFIEGMLHYARYEQIRLPGSPVYTRTTPVEYTTWVDDMFMGIPFLIQAGLYAGNEKDRLYFMEDAAKQAIGFVDEVWNSETNLYIHAHVYGSEMKTPHWSRANGWAIWAMSEILMHLPKNNKYYKPVLAQYRKHVNSLVKLQDESGFWFNVLDRPDSPVEVSGTAIFTMGIARGVTHGWLDAKKYEPVVRKAWHALTTEIDMDGTVHKICMGTMCSEDVNYYINRPFYDNDTHGLFAVLFAGIEVHNMDKIRK